MFKYRCKYLEHQTNTDPDSVLVLHTSLMLRDCLVGFCFFFTDVMLFARFLMTQNNGLILQIRHIHIILQIGS